MPQSLAKVYVHIIFSTKNRQDFIDDAIEGQLFSYIGEMCKKLDCQPIIVGGYRNHIHILCMLSRKIAVMKLLEEVKKYSSKWMKEQGEAYQNFYWQQGYGIFSVRHQDAGMVTNYIATQREHHHKQRYEDEYIGFLKKYEIEYDERYVWD